MSHIAVYILIYLGNHCGYAFTTNYNEKVLKYRVYRVLYALNEKTKVYARKQWNKFAMVCYMWYMEFNGV